MDTPPPKKTVILRLLSYFSKNIFQKTSIKIRWTPFEYFLKTNQLQLILFLNSKKFVDFPGGVTPFCKNKGSQKLDPSWSFFCCEPLKCSGPNMFSSENIDLKKLY